MNRRFFLEKATQNSFGLLNLGSLELIENPISVDDSIHIIAPKAGFTPQVGTLLSMMTQMRYIVTLGVQGLSVKELDYLHDTKSNSIGAMLLHLAATERQYQIKTFEWNIDFKGDGKINWDAAMRLGEKGRKSIKGNNLEYYLNILKETRDLTISEFKKRDDEWINKIDPHGFQNLPTNNFCKWFHVCEHESNHNGQIKWIKSRLPNAKNNAD
jgi:hypothetical protein